jgi:hypothetical protein
MNSKQINTIFKYFMEPCQFHGDVWIMRAKFTPFDTIVSTTYDQCFDHAQEQIDNHFKIVEP